MYRHTKAVTFLFPAIAALFSLAISSSAMAQRAEYREAAAEQDNQPAVIEDNQSDRPRQRGEHVRTEQARTEQEQAQVAIRTTRVPETNARRQEDDSSNNWHSNRRDNSRENSQVGIVRQQNDRDDTGFREQQAMRNNQIREISEREATAERLASSRDNADRSRRNQAEQNRKPMMLDDNRNDDQSAYISDRGRGGDRNRDRNRNLGRDGNSQDGINPGAPGGAPASGITYDESPGNTGNNRGRPDQNQQRRWEEQQRRQANDYRRHFDNQQSNAQRYSYNLREQNRNEQYRSQQRYYDRLNNQRRYFDRQNHDYYRGSYYYSPVIYRYNRGGSYYYANRYQADLMRQAINYGYEEGYHAGRADRMDRWGYNYREAYAYQDANYGYYGYYVDRGTYNYYFREGFRRGYDDGYYSRYRYGRSYNNGYSLNDSVIRLILNFSDWRH